MKSNKLINLSHRRLWLLLFAIATSLCSILLFAAYGVILMGYDDRWEQGHWEPEHFAAWVTSLTGNFFWAYWLTLIGSWTLLIVSVYLWFRFVVNFIKERKAI